MVYCREIEGALGRSWVLHWETYIYDEIGSEIVLKGAFILQIISGQLKKPSPYSRTFIIGVRANF